METKNFKLELESKRKVYFSAGLFIVASTVLMAFSYKVPVYPVKHERIAQTANIPIEYLEKEVEVTVVEIEPVKPIELPSTHLSTPLLSDNLLDDPLLTSNTDEDPDLIVSTSEPLLDPSAIKFSHNPLPAPDLNVVVEFPDALAEFQGVWTSYLSSKLKYPEMSVLAQEEGEIYVNFVVERDGSVSDVKILNKNSPSRLQKEAMRVVKSSPKWKPGVVKGEYVRSLMTVKVNFELE